MPKAEALSWSELSDGDLITVRQLADLLRISKSYLDKARATEGKGPTYTKFGRSVRYAVGDVRMWIDSNKRLQVGWSLTADGDLPEPWEIESWLR